MRKFIGNLKHNFTEATIISKGFLDLFQIRIWQLNLHLKLDSSAFALLFTEISVLWFTEISVVWVTEISVASLQKFL